VKKGEWEVLRENASPTVQAAMDAAMYPEHKVAIAMGAPADQFPKKGIRVPKPRKMNKGEQEYFSVLKQEFPSATAILYEGLTLKLKSGCRYCADFTVWDRHKLLLIVEVKGSYVLASAGRSHLAFKTAASEWPGIPFRYAKKDENGQWQITELNK